MAEITTPRCPVCGTSAESAKQGETSCPTCGAKFAFVSYFADAEDIVVWQEKAEKHKAETVARTCERQFGRSAFSIGDRAAAVVMPKRQLLFRSGGDTEDKLTDVVQISFGGKHCLLLFRDGHVESRMRGSGWANQGQSRVEEWSDVVFVEAGTNCSYGVRRDGTVLVSGIPPVPSENVIELKDIKMLAEGESFLVCVTTTGKIRLVYSSSPNGMRDLEQALAECRNAVSVATAQGCVLALDESGRVYCSCVSNNDPRLGASSWTDISVVAADSHYAVGLTKKGRIRLLGREGYMDAGRRDAVKWDGIVALACAPSGIGAIALDGSLCLAGNIIGADALKKAWQPYSELIASSLIKE